MTEPNPSTDSPRLGPVFDEPWTGATGDADTDIARMERAASKVCGWCGRRLQAWEDLREWACVICAWSGSDTPWEAPA